MCGKNNIDEMFVGIIAKNVPIADQPNFLGSSLLRLVNNCVESIYKTQKSRTKVFPSAMISEKYCSLHFDTKMVVSG